MPEEKTNRELPAQPTTPGGNASAHVPLGVLDLVGAAAALLLGLAIGATPFTVSASFRYLFMDFGAVEELPAMTRLALTHGYGLTCGAVVFLLTIVAFALRRRLVARRVLFALAVVFGVMSVGGYLYGVYSPMFDMVEAVGP